MRGILKIMFKLLVINVKFAALLLGITFTVIFIVQLTSVLASILTSEFL